MGNQTPSQLVSHYEIELLEVKRTYKSVLKNSNVFQELLEINKRWNQLESLIELFKKEAR